MLVGVIGCKVQAAAATVGERTVLGAGENVREAADAPPGPDGRMMRSSSVGLSADPYGNVLQNADACPPPQQER